MFGTFSSNLLKFDYSKLCTKFVSLKFVILKVCICVILVLIHKKIFLLSSYVYYFDELLRSFMNCVLYLLEVLISGFYSIASRGIGIKWENTLPRWVGYIRVASGTGMFLNILECFWCCYLLRKFGKLLNCIGIYWENLILIKKGFYMNFYQKNIIQREILKIF